MVREHIILYETIELLWQWVIPSPPELLENLEEIYPWYVKVLVTGTYILPHYSVLPVSYRAIGCSPIIVVESYHVLRCTLTSIMFPVKKRLYTWWNPDGILKWLKVSIDFYTGGRYERHNYNINQYILIWLTFFNG